MERRREFVEAAIRREHSFTELCRRFGISRKNGYKWLHRYRIELAFPNRDVWFADRNPRPLRQPSTDAARRASPFAQIVAGMARPADARMDGLARDGAPPASSPRRHRYASAQVSPMPTSTSSGTDS